MTLTRTGRVALASAIAASATGIGFRSLAAAAMGATLLLVLAWAQAAPRVARVTVHRRLAAAVAREGEAIEVRTAVGGLPLGASEVRETLPAQLEVREGALGAKPLRGAADISVSVSALVPGRYRIGPARVTFLDALGLVERTILVGDSLPLTILPRAEEVRSHVASSLLARPLSGAHAVNAAGLGSEFQSLREWRDGDSLRDVNWKASARRGGRKLFVTERQHESRAVIHYVVDGRDVAATGTVRQSAWILAGRAVATLARLDQRRRDTPRLLVVGGGPILSPTPGDTLGMHLLAPFLDPPPGAPETFSTAVDRLLATARPRSPVVLVTNLLDDDGAVAMATALRALDCPIVVLAPRGPDLLRLAGAPDAEVADARAARQRSLDALRATGARVVDWDPADPLRLALLKEGFSA